MNSYYHDLPCLIGYRGIRAPPAPEGAIAAGANSLSLRGTPFRIEWQNDGISNWKVRSMRSVRMITFHAARFEKDGTFIGNLVDLQVGTADTGSGRARGARTWWGGFSLGLHRNESNVRARSHCWSNRPDAAIRSTPTPTTITTTTTAVADENPWFPPKMGIMLLTNQDCIEKKGSPFMGT